MHLKVGFVSLCVLWGVLKVATRREVVFGLVVFGLRKRLELGTAPMWVAVRRLPVPSSQLRLRFQELCAISCVPVTLGFSLAVFSCCHPPQHLTCWCWRSTSENNSQIHFTASLVLIGCGFTVLQSLFLSLCIPVGDFSKQLISMWRRAALRGWWPMRISQSSPFQVRCTNVSCATLEDSVCLVWH